MLDTKETLDQAAEKIVLENSDMRATHSMGEFAEFTFKEGTKWQAKRMYSEEDIAMAFNEGQAYSVIGKLVDGKEWIKTHKKEWFEKFKK